jgi:hypothetical protein
MKTTAYNIATALIHFEVNYGNSIILHLPAYQLKHLQLVCNSAGHAVTYISKFHHTTVVVHKRRPHLARPA